MSCERCQESQKPPYLIPTLLLRRMRAREGATLSWLGTHGQLMTELEPEPRPSGPIHCFSCFNRDGRPRSSGAGSPRSWGKETALVSWAAPQPLGSPSCHQGRGKVLIWSLWDRSEGGHFPSDCLPQGLAILGRFRSRPGLPHSGRRVGPGA